MNKDRHHPPRIGEKVLQRLLSESERNTLLGDYEELYKDLCFRRGWFVAGLWYWLQIFILFPVSIWVSTRWSFTMIGNYMKTATRNLNKQRGYSFINIFGLAVSIGICILIFLFVEYELGFDSHIQGKEHLYRVVIHEQRPEGMVYEGCTPFPTAVALENDFPELELAVRVYRDTDVMITAATDRFKESNLLVVEPEFFELEGTKWIVGDSQRSLVSKNSIVLTESLALKYFGKTEVLGKMLRLDNEFDLYVTGVVKDPPRQTSLPYDMLVSWTMLDDYHGLDESLEDKWDFIDGDCHTYLRLPGSVDPEHLEQQFEAFKNKYMDPSHAERWSLRLQAMKDLHFDTRYGSYSYVTSRKTLFAFSAIGFLVLLIACINFINLTTAQAAKRAREMGMRKVLGAVRIQLVRQILGETSLFTFLAMLFAVIMAWALLPRLNQFLGNNTQLRFLPSTGLLIILAVIYIFVNALNGLYPAFVLSRYQPADALKQTLTSHEKRSSRLRNGLVLIQFIGSQILIVGTLVIAGQMKYMSRMDLGFRKEGMVTVSLPAYEETRCEALRGEWLQNPQIQDISFAWSAPTSNSNFNTPLGYEASGSLVEWPVDIKMCDKRYLDVYDIPLIAGRFFEQNANDESNKQWVVNEAVVRSMGLSDPFEAVGKLVNVNGFDGEIIGVIGDFHVQSLHSRIKPTVFFNFWPSNYREAQIRMSLKDTRSTIGYIERVWTETYPEYVFEYEFLDEFLEGLYASESRMLTMIRMVSLLAILIGCLGLLGLVSFMVLQRTKEIGVRKVLGATGRSVFMMISKDFLKWVMIANFLAWPIAYIFMTGWLRNYAFRIELHVWFFILSGLAALTLALLSVCYQTIKAANANPVEALKYE